MKNNNYSSAPAMHFVWKAAFVSMFVICAVMQASAQTTSTQTIRGIVKSADDNQPVPGTNISLKNASSVGTLADTNGQFEFPGQLRVGDVLVFTFMGLKTTEYVVTDQSTGLINITMPADFIQMVDEIIVEGEVAVQPVTDAKRLRKTNR